MARLNRAQSVLSLRIVYDGPGEAGKTTTLRALSQRLERACVTPEEAGGRTLYFDYFSYRGGLFEGCQIDCQVVSVPGQVTLAQRRSFLLGIADVFVYVAPVTVLTIDSCISALQALVGRTPPLGVVFQVNKRDQPDALPLDEIKSRLEAADLRVALVETQANEGAGVREAFIFAVRLALDSVRARIAEGTMPEGDPDIRDADELLARMRTHQMAGSHDQASSVSSSRTPGGASKLVSESLDQIANENAAHARGSQGPEVLSDGTGLGVIPLTPGSSVPSGHIWPPVEGRVCLKDASDGPVELDEINGDWWASTSNGWRFFSAGAHFFRDAEAGRVHLLELARQHSTVAPLLSGPRCVVLASDHGGGWRLWQVARERLSLRDRLSGLLGEKDEFEIARLIVDTTRRLFELAEVLQRFPSALIRPTLDSTGLFMGKTQYVGLFDGKASGLGLDTPSIEAQLRPVFRDWGSRAGKIVRVLKEGDFGEMEAYAKISAGLFYDRAEPLG